MTQVVFIGAGNLATQLSLAMSENGFQISQVYSFTEKSAKELALKLGCEHTTQISEIKPHADLYIFSVKDDVLVEVIQKMPHKDGLWVHTAGSLPMSLFAEHTPNYGVFYPLQTFSKARKANFNKIPFFIEAHQDIHKDLLMQYAQALSEQVYEADSQQRKQMHLAAVFACNFSNHMFAVAQNILTENNLPFQAIAPLIQETASKLESMSALSAQTGPATRMDEMVMQNHIEMLQDEHLKELYEKISQNIYRYKQK